MSLRRMREAMLSRSELSAAVFIGGMEGVQEFELFRQHHPDAPVVPVAAPGGAAREIRSGFIIYHNAYYPYVGKPGKMDISEL